MWYAGGGTRVGQVGGSCWIRTGRGFTPSDAPTIPSVSMRSIMRAARFVIGEPLGAGESRVEVFGVEVKVVDRMAGGGQTLDDQPVQRGVETFLDGMGAEDEDFHASTIRRCAPAP